MEQEIVIPNSGLIGAPMNELDSIVKKRRKEIRTEKEKKVGEFLCRIAGLPSDKRIIEIQKEFGIEICLVKEEISLNLRQLGDIIVYRAMCKEPCPAAELDLCVFGYKNVLTKEKCLYCQGNGTAEWDNY